MQSHCFSSQFWRFDPISVYSLWIFLSVGRCWVLCYPAKTDDIQIIWGLRCLPTKWILQCAVLGGVMQRLHLAPSTLLGLWKVSQAHQGMQCCSGGIVLCPRDHSSSGVVFTDVCSTETQFWLLEYHRLDRPKLQIYHGKTPEKTFC